MFSNVKSIYSTKIASIYYTPVNQSKTHWGTNGDDIHIGIWGTDTFYASYGADGYYGRGGSDRVNYRWSNEAVEVDLTTGLGEGGYSQGDRYFSIENITGSRYDDWMRGNASDNDFDGGSGNDTFRATDGNDTYNGGHGRHDRIEYFDLDNGIVVHMAQGQVTQAGSNKVDRFINVEEISGTHYDDVFLGDDGNNWFFGAAGDDTFYADAGADTYFGGYGNDTIVIEGDDLHINLNTGATQNGDVAGDRYDSIENITIEGTNNTAAGDKFDNVIASTGVGAKMYGGAGDDVIILYNGDNFLGSLNDGDDRLEIHELSLGLGHFNKLPEGNAYGGDGFDTLDLSNFNTSIAYFGFGENSFVVERANVYLHGDHYSFTGLGATVTANGFESIVGGSGDDLFVASILTDETFTGGKGADTFYFDLFFSNNDVITDFQSGEDQIHIEGLSSGMNDEWFELLASGDNPQLEMRDTDNGTLLDIYGTQILLEGVRSAELSSDDFMWS